MSSLRDIVFDVARVTVEAEAPFAVGTGRGDDLRDALYVTDANGLPALPGTTLAGLLRHALATLGTGDPEHDPACQRWFGHQAREDGRASRVETSWGQVHDEQDRVVPFVGRPLEGSVLRLLAEGIVRDHVRLDHRGVVDDHGKFDETVAPAGARFTFELRVHADAAEGDERPLDTLLGLIAAGLRVGGHTRSGLGSFRLARAEWRRFDLRKADDRAAWGALPRALHEPVPKSVGLKPWSGKAVKAGRRVRATVALFPEDHWIFGGGLPHRAEQRRKRRDDAEKGADVAPYTEARIVWTDRGAQVLSGDRAPFVAVATGIKGALRHRVAFHHRALTGHWAAEGKATAPEDDGAVRSLFGHAREKGEEGRPEGRPGRVWIGDALPRGEKVAALDHVSLDRFTGAPMDGFLFSEAPLFKGDLSLEIVIDTDGRVSRVHRQALARALADLCEGRLAVGAGANRGHGYFNGTVSWDDGGAWIGGGE